MYGSEADIEELENIPIIITGFRSGDEIESFKRQYYGDAVIEVIFVDADPTIRYQRCIARQRADSKKDRDAFNSADEQQRQMGLSNIRDKYAQSLITNNATFEAYFSQFDEQYASDLDAFNSEVTEDNPPLKKPHRLEDEIILSLSLQSDMKHYYTTAEIAQLINQTFDYDLATKSQRPKSKNNVSRYFNQEYHPYYEISIENRKRKYRLSQSGRGRARWLMRLLS